MKNIKLSIIVAIAQGGLIGNSLTNKVPWYLPKDLKHFKEITTGNGTGNVMIMGSRTYESFGKPLPNREHIIISRNPNYIPINGNEHVFVCSSLEDAIRLAGEIANGEKEIFIVGGGQVYLQLLSDQVLRMMVTKLFLTIVEGKFEGNVFFPEISPFEWRETFSEAVEPDEKNPYPFTFKTMVPFNTAP